MIKIPKIPDPAPLAAGSTVIIAKGIPWDRTYKHVRLFASSGACYNFVLSKAVWTTTGATTVKNNRVRVPVSEPDLLENANYMTFINSQFSSDFKVHAFITNILYISATVAEVDYEIDVFQTYFYNCTLNKCYVERQHIFRSEDRVGVNLLPEPVNLGTYKQYSTQLHSFNSMMCVLYHTSDQYAPDYYGDVNGFFTGVRINVGSIEQIKSMVTDLVSKGQENAIIMIQMCPAFCIDNLTGTTLTVDYKNAFGFTPKNKKMYTYPFCYVHVDDYQGSDRDYYFELVNNSNDPTMSFRVRGCFVGLPTIVTYPLYYNNQDNGDNNNIVTNNFPQCAFSGNSYAQWLNSNKINMGAAVTTQAISALGSMFLAGVGAAATGGATAGMAATAAGSVVNNGIGLINTGITQQASEQTAKNAPNASHGNLGSSCYNITYNRNQIAFFVVGCDEDSAKAADDFMSVYGYTVNKVTNINTYNRNIWNYCKTRDCNVTGDIAYNAREGINAIFNNGVFIWHTNNVGNFDIEGNG